MTYYDCFTESNAISCLFSRYKKLKYKNSDMQFYGGLHARLLSLDSVTVLLTYLRMVSILSSHSQQESEKAYFPKCQIFFSSLSI